MRPRNPRRPTLKILFSFEHAYLSGGSEICTPGGEKTFALAETATFGTPHFAVGHELEALCCLLAVGRILVGMPPRRRAHVQRDSTSRVQPFQKGAHWNVPSRSSVQQAARPARQRARQHAFQPARNRNAARLYAWRTCTSEVRGHLIIIDSLRVERRSPPSATLHAVAQIP